MSSAGFVSYDNRDSAEKAISQMNGYQVRLMSNRVAVSHIYLSPDTAVGDAGQHGAARRGFAHTDVLVRSYLLWAHNPPVVYLFSLSLTHFCILEYSPRGRRRARPLGAATFGGNL